MNLHHLDKNTLISIIESLDTTIYDLRADLADAQDNLYYANAEVERRGYLLDDANTSIRVLQDKVAKLSGAVLQRFEDAVDNDVRAQLDALFAERGRRNKRHDQAVARSDKRRSARMQRGHRIVVRL